MTRPLSNVRHLFHLAWQNHFLVLCLAILALSAVSFVGPFRDLKFADEREYFEIAKNLVEFGVYGFGLHHPTAHRAPGYTLFVAALLGSGLGKDIINIVQVLLWALNAYLSAQISLRLSGQAAAGAALILSLLYPPFAYVALRAYPQTLTTTLLLLIFFLLFSRSNMTANSGKIAGIGVIAGLLILTTPPLVLMLAGIAGVAFILRLVSFRSVLVATMIACVVVTPWLARNQFVFDRAVLATTGGVTFLKGNSENAQPDVSEPDISRYMEATKNFDEFAMNDYFYEAALNWVKSNPQSAAWLYIRKLFQYFGYREKYATAETGGTLAEAVLFATYYPLLILAITNLFLARRWSISREEILLFTTYLGSAAVYALFVVRIRYRLPFDTIVIILAALAIGRFVGGVPQPRS